MEGGVEDRNSFQNLLVSLTHLGGVVSWCHQSEKQMANHRQSKAHRKMVESLRAEFGDEILDALHEESDGSGESGGEREESSVPTTSPAEDLGSVAPPTPTDEAETPGELPFATWP